MKTKGPIFLRLILVAALCGVTEAQATAYTLTLTANHGSVAVTPNKAQYEPGEKVELIPRPATGYCFTGWSGDAHGKNLVLRLTMDRNKAVTANFGPWTPPIGIPAPIFGIAETYRMYDTPANRNGNLTYSASAGGGYYTHYVDPTDPAATNDANPYGTIAKPRLSVPVLPAGSVCEVHSGPTNLNPDGAVSMVAHGTAQQPVFIRGIGTPRVTSQIQIGYYYGDTHYLILEGFSCLALGIYGRMQGETDVDNSYIAIRNCEITGGGSLSLDSWTTNTIHHVVLYQNTVHENGTWDPNVAQGDRDIGGITINNNVSYVWILENDMHHNEGDGVQINSGNSPADTHHIYVGKNTVSYNKQSGLWTKSADDIIFSQNVVRGMRESSSASGQGMGLQADPRRVWFLFNEVYDCEIGFMMGSNNIGGGGGYYFIGNVIHDIHTDSTADYEMGMGFAGWNQYSPLLAYNTFYDVDGGAMWDSAHLFTFRDNITYDVGEEGSIKMVTWNNSSIGDNLLDPTDPKFVSTNDFHLQASSPAIDAGTPSEAVQQAFDRFQQLYGMDIGKDIEGRTRPQGSAWDLGAYEYVLEAINNLAVSSTSQNSVTLTWTMPNEEGVTGKPTRYDIRYAGSPLTGANWDAATQVQGEPAPGGFGEQQSFTITGLNPGATYYVGIKILDEAGRTSALSKVVSATTADSGNHAPVLVPIGDRSVGENATLTLAINATDAEGDTLTYSATNLPAGASFAAATRMFTWTPTNLQSGQYRVTIQVSDGQATVSETITITVGQGASHAPVLAAIGNKSVNENTSLSFSVSATDQDGGSLSFSAAGLPHGASFANRVFNWTPGYDQAGSYLVTFTASDGELTDSEPITITVVDVAQGSDLTAPVAHGFYPAPDAIQAPLNSLVTLAISDSGSGVDAGTVVIRVNDQLVYSGDSGLYESAYGVCRRMGTRASYRYYYRPAKPFDFSQEVSVRANASDAAHNAMTPVSYQFVTEMYSFGRNLPVSSSSDSSGHPAVATDSQGNLWAVWHAGPADARDIYIAKRSSQGQAWDVPLRLTNLGSDQCNPAIALGSDDALYVAWQDQRRGNWDIYAAVSRDGNTWGDPVRITDSNDSQTNPVMATDHASPYHMYIAWEDDGAGNQDIYLASSSASFAGKTITRITTNAANQTNPALAVGSDNTVYLAWTDQRNGSADIYGSSSSASSWTNVPIATGPGNQRDPALAAEPGTSRLHMLWVDDAAGNSDILYGTSEGLPGSPISGTTIIDDTTNAEQSAPTIVTARDRESNTHVYAGWQDHRAVGNTLDSDLYFVELRSGAGGTNVLVGDDGTNSNQSEPALAFDEQGRPVIVWTDGRGSTPAIYSAGSTYFQATGLASALITRSAGGRVGQDPASIQAGGDVSIQIPSYAFDYDAVLSISEIRNPPGFTAPCLAGYEIGPSGVQFSFPATVTIPYVSSGSGRGIPYWYDAQTGTLSQEGMTEITNRALANGLSVVSFKTAHLTSFYVLESPVGSGGGGPAGGGCELSHSQEGSIVEYLFPYAVLAVYMVLLRCRDRRHKGDAGNASLP